MEERERARASSAGPPRQAIFRASVTAARDLIRDVRHHELEQRVDRLLVVRVELRDRPCAPLLPLREHPDRRVRVHPAEAVCEHVTLSVRPCQRLSVRRLSALVRAWTQKPRSRPSAHPFWSHRATCLSQFTPAMRTFASGFSAQYLPSFRYLRQTPCQLQSPPIPATGRARRRTHDVGGRIAMRRDRLGASVGRTRLELRGKDHTMGRRTYESTHTGM